MTRYIAIFLLLICGIAGCKSNKAIQQPNDGNGTVIIKSTPAAGYTSTLSGHVKDIKTGELLSDAQVILLKDATVIGGARTDADGYFQLKDIPNGNYLLRISYVGSNTLDAPLEIKDASSIKVDAQLKMREILLEKPVIYLYPAERKEITVKLNYDGNLKHTYPAYSENGWKVTVEPNGVLWDEEGKEYYALFWEGTPKSQLDVKDGFIIPGNETVTFLEEKLAYLGLNRREANEFIMYWLPRLETNPYNLIHFAGSDYERLAELQITPQPETIIRVMMLTQPLQFKIDFPLQDISALKKVRKGYTVVEWGGSIVDCIENDFN